MSDHNEIIQAISALSSEMNQRLDGIENELRSEMNLGFKSINKRLDGIENELRKIDTVLSYQDQYDNIPS